MEEVTIVLSTKSIENLKLHLKKISAKDPSSFSFLIDNIILNFYYTKIEDNKNKQIKECVNK